MNRFRKNKDKECGTVILKLRNEEVVVLLNGEKVVKKISKELYSINTEEKRNSVLFQNKNRIIKILFFSYHFILLSISLFNISISILNLFCSSYKDSFAHHSINSHDLHHLHYYNY